MRIAIREQLVLLVTLTVLVSLAVVALPTWFFVHRFVINVRRDSLALTASLKASKISADLDLVRSNCRTISSRILIQNGLNAWYVSRNADTWAAAKEDLEIALSSRSQTGLLQARIYSRDGSSDPGGIVNVTGRNIPRIRLPYDEDDGSPVYLGDDGENSYPTPLYPNITFENQGTRNPENNLTEWKAYTFGNISMTNSEGVLLGPMAVNETYALLSVTLPIRDYEQPDFTLGFLTIVASASSLISNVNSREGLGDTGVVLLAGPDNPANRFNQTTRSAIRHRGDDEITEEEDSFLRDVDFHYVLPVVDLPGEKNRHPKSAYGVRSSEVFSASEYPAVLRSLEDPPNTVNQAGSVLSTTNENGASVAVGFARTNTSLANWTVLVEQAREEAYRPITTLTKILLGCTLGTAGAIFLLTYPCAHIGVLPIRRLKAATEKTVAPPGYEDGYFDGDYHTSEGATPGSGGHSSKRSQTSKKGWIGTILTSVGLQPTSRQNDRASDDSELRPFRIPGKVSDRKHLITDELTELTKTFNDMSDELLKQYTVLDDKVAERTRELEISKKAAEAANESKTLFIANISHELKTPLNGILGMCAVSMEEDDVDKIKQSLRTLYKSGDLLLHLLEDLLSFSKNQIGQQLALEQKEFGLVDIRSQILTIFDKQVRENDINFSVLFLHTSSIEAANQDTSGAESKVAALGPQGTGKLKDMCLYGDQHRILQVIINLVSNSLKFTPKGGKVEVRIRCLSEAEADGVAANNLSRSSSASKGSNTGYKRKRLGSTSSLSASSRIGSVPGADPVKGTALTINPMEPKVSPPVYVRGRSRSPPPANARSYIFEFEVEDTGPGIPDEMQQRVFEPFVQGDWGLSRRFGGTGLGLSICQQLANLMGGHITLQSTVGKGSVFTMQIPLMYLKDRSPSAGPSIGSRKPEENSDSESKPTTITRPKPAVTAKTRPNSHPEANAETKAAVLDREPRLVGLRQPYFVANPPSPPSQGAVPAAKAAVESALAARKNHGGPCGKLRVLVADDNSTNIEVVSKMLKLEEVSDVTIAKDGQEAYEQVKAAMAEDRQFDLIFMDVQMPNLDGLQSTRMIRGMGYKSPIVALTAFSEESNVRECIESGMDEFLSKPIRRPALKEVLHRFATIYEESESAIVTPATTPGVAEKGPIGEKGPLEVGPLANGVAPGASPLPVS